MIKIKKFWIVAKVPSNGTPYCSKKFATLKGAKDHAQIERGKGKVGGAYGVVIRDYVIMEAIEYIKIPVPPATWTKIEE